MRHPPIGSSLLGTCQAAARAVREELPMMFLEAFQDSTGPDRGIVILGGHSEHQEEGQTGPTGEDGQPITMKISETSGNKVYFSISDSNWTLFEID